MKQTFEIPQGCTRVTIEQHEDKSVTIFEIPIKESFMDKVVRINMTTFEQEMKEPKINEQIEPEVRFKDGDIISGDDEDFVFIFQTEERAYCGINSWGKLDIENYTHGGNNDERYRIATESEKKHLFDALAKVGKRWNAEKKCIEELKPERWRAKNGSIYFYIDSRLLIEKDVDNRHIYDDTRYNVGNYFQTEQQAKDFAARIKQLPR